jgi:hypothetical protein
MNKSDLRPQLSSRDLVDEALASLTARPGRAVLTALGTVLGVAALVATLGLSKTAGNQIVGRFDALAATDITVTPKTAGAGRAGGGGGSVLPWDAEARITRLNGIVAAGSLSDVDLHGDLVRSVPVNDPVTQTEFQLPVKAASPGLFAAVRAELASGRLPDAGHSARADRVALVGANVAEQLHATRIEEQPAIFLGDRLYTVIGVLGKVARQASLLGSVVIPEGTAGHDFGLAAPGSVQIETRIGAANLIAGQLPLALNPSDPAALKVTAPPEPRRVRAGVQSDLNTLFLLLGAVSLFIGAVGIANVTLVSVLERVGEIGLRRSLGASTPPHRRPVPAGEHHARPAGRRAGGGTGHDRRGGRGGQQDLDAGARAVGAPRRSPPRRVRRAAVGDLPVGPGRPDGAGGGAALDDVAPGSDCSQSPLRTLV